ncbi:PD-(D/E)XK motif protein [Methylobacterium sp. CM6257]
MLSSLRTLRVQLEAEPRSSEPDTIVALPVPGFERYHLGLSNLGQLCALIETRGRQIGADVQLRNLDVRQGVRCRVRTGGTTDRVLDGSLIICRAEVPALADLFIRLYADAIGELGADPSPQAVSAWLQRLTNLLSRLEEEGRKRLQGLWAELLIIKEVGDPLLALRRWRADPHERFDFLGTEFGLEVKSCRDFDRVHEFALEQLRPPQGLEVWVASIVVRRDPVGSSVLGLLSELEAQISDPEARRTLRENVLASAGATLEDDEHHRFDLNLARESLRFLDVAAVPSVRGEIPQQVISVRIQSCCAEVLEVGNARQVLERLR